MATLTAACTKVASGANIFSFYRPASGSTVRPLLLLLLHGYPQNHKMWLSFAERLPTEWPLLIPDLPGYGQSEKEPSQDGSSTAHSKRAWAKDMVDLIHARHEHVVGVIAYGHDRGARLAYRIALDFSDLVCRLGVLDIVPTAHVWQAMSLPNSNPTEIQRTNHWVFLSAPSPIPENIIEEAPEKYYEETISAGSVVVRGVKRRWGRLGSQNRSNLTLVRLGSPASMGPVKMSVQY